MPAKSPKALIEKVLPRRSSSNPVMTNSVVNITNVSQHLLFKDEAQLIIFTVDATIATRLLPMKEREAAHNGGSKNSHSQQMGSTVSSPEGNSKTEPVKSATIHDGKCLTFRANANGSHVRSKLEQGRAIRNEAQFKNGTNSLSADRFSG